MRKLTLTIPLLLLVSCQPKADQSTSSEEASQSVAEESVATFDLSNPDSLLGHSLEEVSAACEAAEIPYRILSVDGDERPMTMDFIEHRLNFSVENGVITKVTNG